MANSLLTPTQVTREALRLFRNSNAFLRNINTEYDDSFARSGAKIGNTLRIRLPNDYTVRTGPTAVAQDTTENYTTLTVSSQKGVDVSFSSVDRTLSLDDYSKRVLAPAINTLAGAVAADVMSVADGVPNYVSKTSGGAVVSPDASTWLLAGANLDFNNAPRDRRVIIMDVLTQARTVSSLTGLFNPQATISDQYRGGEMTTNTLGFNRWDADQTVLLHTTAAYGTTPTVNGGSQTGSTITINAATAPISKGDIITFAGVNAVNRITKQSTGTLRQFVVTSNVAISGTSISIYPALTPASGGNPVPYQTVDASPSNGAAITVVSQASEQYRKNLAFHPEAFTLATADLELPRGVHEAARETLDGISMRMVTGYNITSDQFLTRLDILYGFALLRPEWACIVADAL
jgi:hypothetical protein